MLDIMRKKKRMKEIVLWAVIIAVGLSMVVWGVALNLGGGSGPAATDYAAIVDDRPISVQEFKTTFDQSIRELKQQFPDDLDPDIIKSLGMSQQVLNRLVRGKIVEILAERNGLSVSPNEIRQAILKDPDLQVEGKFIGLEQYKNLLAYNGIPVESYEDDVRYNLLAIKLTRLITDSLEISDQKLREEYQKRNQTTKVSYV
ncbi:MAG: SurA N-terminal domain-containing protein, partial [Acidobacteriota bacterium]